MDWDPLGYTARLAQKTREGVATIITGEKPAGSCRLQIRRGGSLWLIMFGSAGERIADQDLCFSSAEYQTAFNIGNDRVNDPDFARDNLARYGIPEKFVRCGDHVIFLCKDKQGQTHAMSVYISFSIRQRAKELI